MPSGSAAILARISASARAVSASSAAANSVVAVFVEQRMQAPLAELERIELAVEVAPVRLRHPRVGGEDVDDVLAAARRRVISFTGGTRKPS